MKTLIILLVSAMPFCASASTNDLVAGPRSELEFLRVFDGAWNFRNEYKSKLTQPSLTRETGTWVGKFAEDGLTFQIAGVSTKPGSSGFTWTFSFDEKSQTILANVRGSGPDEQHVVTWRSKERILQLDTKDQEATWIAERTIALSSDNTYTMTGSVKDAEGNLAVSVEGSGTRQSQTTVQPENSPNNAIEPTMVRDTDAAEESKGIESGTE